LWEAVNILTFTFVFVGSAVSENFGSIESFGGSSRKGKLDAICFRAEAAEP
jgi:hypothetical protein